MTTRRELLGYTDRLSVSPGETIRFMVSSEFPAYEATIVRLIHGDENPAGPGFKEATVATSVDGRRLGRRQATHPGSYVRVDGGPALDRLTSLTLQAWILPTTPLAGRAQ